MDGSSRHQLSAELIDGITEAVVSPTDPRARADVISDLVHEVDEAVKWRNERHPGGEEELSLAALVTAAEVHRHRMDDVPVDLDDEDPVIEDLGIVEDLSPQNPGLEDRTAEELTTVTGGDFQTLPGRPAPARAVQE